MVDIVDIGALVTSPWGITGIFAKINGGGFLTDHYPDAKKVIWDLQGIYIEMSGYLDLHVDLIKGGVSMYGMVNPIFKPGPVEPRYSEYLVFEGISVDEQAFTARGKAFGTPRTLLQ